MMRTPFLTRFWRRLTKPAVITVDDIVVPIDERRAGRSAVRALYRGDYEAAERSAALACLLPGDRVLEGGSGLGLVSAIAAKIVGPANIMCFEASSEAFSLLQETMQLNGFQAAALENKALSLASGPIEFFLHPNILSSSLSARPGAHRSIVESVDIRDVIGSFRPNVLLLDVEGAEAELLGQIDLSKIRLLIVELHAHIVGLIAINSMLSKMQAAGFCVDRSLSAQNVVVLTKYWQSEP